MLWSWIDLRTTAAALALSLHQGQPPPRARRRSCALSPGWAWPALKGRACPRAGESLGRGPGLGWLSPAPDGERRGVYLLGFPGCAVPAAQGDRGIFRVEAW